VREVFFPGVPQTKEDAERVKFAVYSTKGIRGLYVSQDDTAALVNALDFLHQEWAYKPIAFVSYGGVSGGTRAVQMGRLIATTLRMAPIPEGVPIPFYATHMKDGVFAGTDAHVKSLDGMLNELARWATALAPLRAPR